MDFTQLALLALSLVCSILGWFARQIWSAVQEMKKEIGDVRILMGTEYVRHDRMREVIQDAMKPIMDSLHEIKMTLAGKADK